jgi:hypothetical protein
MYFSGIDDYPELDLEEMFNRVFDNYPSEFRDYWGLDGEHSPRDIDADTWDRYRDLDKLALRVSELAGALVRPPKIKEEDLGAPVSMRAAAERVRSMLADFRKQLEAERPPNYDEISRILSVLILKEEAEYQFFRAALQLYLSPFLVWPKDLAERVVQLTRYARRVKSERARQYLSRVSRCYIYGMTAELAVMARAVLGALVEEAISEDQVRASRGLSKRERVGLSAYLAVADGTLLSREGVTAAKKIKQFGDDAAHVSTELVDDPDAILEELVLVLEDFEKHQRAK